MNVRYAPKDSALRALLDARWDAHGLDPGQRHEGFAIFDGEHLIGGFSLEPKECLIMHVSNFYVEPTHRSLAGVRTVWSHMEAQAKALGAHIITGYVRTQATARLYRRLGASIMPYAGDEGAFFAIEILP